MAEEESVVMVCCNMMAVGFHNLVGVPVALEVDQEANSGHQRHPAGDSAKISGPYSVRHLFE